MIFVHNGLQDHAALRTPQYGDPIAILGLMELTVDWGLVDNDCSYVGRHIVYRLASPAWQLVAVFIPYMLDAIPLVGPHVSACTKVDMAPWQRDATRFDLWNIPEALMTGDWVCNEVIFVKGRHIDR
ncbi:hypothetical protein VD17_06885 [Pseudomonas fluorescens]|uniref:Uncharacterized protein n=1 Tax=Pseudomonas fluorescens TaxID=294 RepID=A0A0F4VEX9_PSEFL|nr:hypothetical protein VD17_06885 [Pseudomonas fluorescens]